MTTERTPVADEAAVALFERLNREAGQAGYHMNPDTEFVLGLMRGLLTNKERYGFMACPCRLASGVREKDLDIICPCDYRDPDLAEFGGCYCALYVSNAVLQGKQRLESIPERRPPAAERGIEEIGQSIPLPGVALPFPVYRCPVCGYLCAMNTPPLVCPICKADRDRFVRFL
jgi:ferredoxin-thioredoxin reductase catalytic subunit